MNDGDHSDWPAPDLSSLARKSALLNLTIVVTVLPVMTFAGGPGSVAPTAVLLLAISGLIWVATLAGYSFVSLARLFVLPRSGKGRRRPVAPAGGQGVEDAWLDGSA